MPSRTSVTTPIRLNDTVPFVHNDNIHLVWVTEMDEIGMGRHSGELVVTSHQERPASDSRSPRNLVAPRPPSGTRPRSGTWSGTNVRPASGPGVNTHTRPSARPLSGTRASRPLSAEGGLVTAERCSVVIKALLYQSRETPFKYCVVVLHVHSFIPSYTNSLSCVAYGYLCKKCC